MRSTWASRHILAAALLRLALLHTSSSFTPLSIPSLAQWFDAADTYGNGSVVPAGTLLSQWVDKSTTGNNFIQSSGQPSVNVDTGGYTNVLFSTGVTMSNTYTHAGSGGRTSFIVMQDVNTVASDTFGDPAIVFMGVGTFAGNSWRLCFLGTNPNGALGIDINNGAKAQYNPSQSITIQNNRVVGMWAIGTGGTVNSGVTMLNGVSQTTVSSVVGGTITISAAGTSSVMGTGYTTHVYEYLYFNASLTAIQIQAVTYYLSTKWGVSGVPTASVSPTVSPSSAPPSRYSSLAQWFDAMDILGTGATIATGTSIPTWVDKSSSGLNFVQPTPAAEPVASVDSGGYPAVYFTTGDSMSNTYTQIGTGGRTSFAVFWDVNTVSGDPYGDPPLLFSGTPGSGPGLSWRYGFVGNTGSLGVDINAGARGNTYPGQTVTCQSQRVIGMWAIQSGGTVGSSYTFLNGINQTIINASVGLTVGINTAGSSSVIGTGYSTYVHEVLHFNAELGRADIETITYYLATKWGINGVASASVSPTSSVTPSCSTTVTVTVTVSASTSPTSTVTVSQTVTVSTTSTTSTSTSATVTSTTSSTTTQSVTVTSSASTTATLTVTSTYSGSGSPTSTTTATASDSTTVSATGTRTGTSTVTVSVSSSASSTSSVTASSSSTATWTSSGSVSATVSASASASMTVTMSASCTGTTSGSSSPTGSPTLSSTMTVSSTDSVTGSSSTSVTSSGTTSRTVTVSSTVSPSVSASSSVTPSYSATVTTTPSYTSTPSATPYAHIWGQLGRSSQHTGVSSYPGHVGLTAAPRWQFSSAGGGIMASAAVIASDGILYVGSSDKSVYAVSPSGTSLWSFATGDAITSSPALSRDGTVYIGSRDKVMYALFSNGTLRWAFRGAGNAYQAAPAIGPDGTVYVGNANHVLYALSGASGVVLWNLTFAGNPTPAAVAANGATLVVGCSNKYLYAVSPVTGSLLWTLQSSILPGAGFGTPSMDDTTVYAGSTDYTVYAVTITSGASVWVYVTGNEVIAPPSLSVDGSIVIVPSTDGNLYGLTSDSGSLEWLYSVATGGTIPWGVAIGSTGLLYVSTSDNTVLSGNTSSGSFSSMWSVSFGGTGVQGGPIVTSNDCVIVCVGNTLVAIASPSVTPTTSVTPSFTPTSTTTATVTHTKYPAANSSAVVPLIGALGGVVVFAVLGTLLGCLYVKRRHKAMVKFLIRSGKAGNAAPGDGSPSNPHSPTTAGKPQFQLSPLYAHMQSGAAAGAGRGEDAFDEDGLAIPSLFVADRKQNRAMSRPQSTRKGGLPDRQGPVAGAMVVNPLRAGKTLAAAAAAKRTKPSTDVLDERL